VAFYDESKLEVLIDQDTLQARIRALGAQITADYEELFQIQRRR